MRARKMPGRASSRPRTWSASRSTARARRRSVPAPEVVAAIAENLIAIGVPAKQIYVYERFDEPVAERGLREVPARGREHVRGGDFARIDSRLRSEDLRGDQLLRRRGYALEPGAAGSETLTKIINVPNMKEHQASGVTGCLKNIAYGNYSNVARSHRFEEDQHADVYRHAGGRRAGALARGAEHHGRSARRVARRSVQRQWRNSASTPNR